MRAARFACAMHAMDTTIRSAARPSSAGSPAAGRSSCTSRCTRPIRCWKAPSPSPSSPSWRSAHGFPAVGLTDTNNLFGALEFSDKLADAGIQPIVGCTLQVDFGDRAAGQRPAARRRQSAALAAGRRAGAARQQRARLAEPHEARLAAPSSIPPRTRPPHIEVERLEAHGDGLIALTGGPDGPIDKALREGQKEVAFERLKALEKIFGDRLYVEIQRHGLKHEIETEPMLLELAYARALPIVATNEVYFAAPDDYEAHDALLCIAERQLRHGGQPPAAVARAFLQDRRADGGAVRRPAGGAWPTPSRSPSAAPSGRRGASRSCRASSPAAPGTSEEELLRLETAELRAQAEAGLAGASGRDARRRRASRRRTTRSASPSRSTSSRR